MNEGAINDPVSRRALLRAACAVAAIAPVLPLQRAWSADPAHLAVDDPLAMKLGYVEEANRVDRRKYPQYIVGSYCDNCLLLQGKSGDTYRPCSAFPNKLVKISGWCTSWTAEI